MAQISLKKIQPIGPSNAEILIIGEAPDESEEALNTIFIGLAGDLLWNCLSNIGIDKTQCRVHNLCNYKPVGNIFAYCEDTPQLTEGLKEIDDFIKGNKDLKLVLLLGEKPLEYILKKYGINRWRGSAFTINSIIYFPTFHPAFIIRTGSDFSLFSFDIGKIPRLLSEGIKQYDFTKVIDPRGMELIEAISEILTWPDFTVDIESVRDSTHILCVGFAHKEKAICIVNHASIGRDIEFDSAIAQILESPIPKIFHNAIFDMEMLRLNGFIINSLHWDTMVAQHILEPELSRSLGFLTSIYTDLPYFKDMGKSAIPDNEKAWGSKVDKSKLYEYNCMDVLSTYLIFQAQQLEVIDDFEVLFNYEMEMLEVSMHISKSGMLVDQQRKHELDIILTQRARKKQALLNAICEKNVNVRSVKLKEVLYTDFKLPTRRKRDGSVTTDEDAIVSLIAYAKDKFESMVTENKELEWMKILGALKLILEIRGIRVLLSNFIDMTQSNDGRLRSSWNVAATETGRWSSSGYVDGTGGNNQTWARESLELDDMELEILKVS